MNKNTWRYIYFYRKIGEKGMFYFDIITDMGKKGAELQALEYMDNIGDKENWDSLTYISKRLQSRG
jgi:hypothetical protein